MSLAAWGSRLDTPCWLMSRPVSPVPPLQPPALVELVEEMGKGDNISVYREGAGGHTGGQTGGQTTQPHMPHMPPWCRRCHLCCSERGGGIRGPHP